MTTVGGRDYLGRRERKIKESTNAFPTLDAECCARKNP